MRIDLTHEDTTRISCPLTRVAAEIADIWILSIIDALSTEPRRFTELHERLQYLLPGRSISTRTLCQRLSYLIEHGYLTKDQEHYALTPMGRNVLPVLDAFRAVDLP